MLHSFGSIGCAAAIVYSHVLVLSYGTAKSGRYLRTSVTRPDLLVKTLFQLLWPVLLPFMVWLSLSF